jgi:hypothetical protein
MTMTMDAKSLHLGKNIAAICPHKYVGKNNCAHYVGHVLGLDLGTLCNLTTKKQAGRASIRVNEVFNNLERTGLWKDRPHVVKGERLLIFVTSAKHVDEIGVMNDHPEKHVGLLAGDKIYNYSNAHHRVVADTIKHFFDKCDSSYVGDDITLYYGVVS